MELPFDSAIPLLRIYPKNPELPTQIGLCTPMFIAILFAIAKSWKEIKCHQEMTELKNCGTFTQWNITQQKERRSSYSSKKKQNMDGTGEHYVK